MAHLAVEPKPSRLWWIWFLLAVILIAIAAFLFGRYGTDDAHKIVTNAAIDL